MRRIVLAAAILVAPAAAMADSEVSLVLQGGASHYQQSLSGSNYGVSYGARLGVMPLSFLGVEVGYLGTRNDLSVSSDGSVPAATLSTNEGYADLRVNLFPNVVTPYVFGGYGLTWVNGAAAAGIANDHVSTLPFGGGLEANVSNFKVGARFQYNYLFNDIFADPNHRVTGGPSVVDKGGHADFWAATIDVGISFR